MEQRINKKFLVQRALSPFQKYCSGFRGDPDKSYILGFVLSVVKMKERLSHSGSWLLDKINALDLAEVESVNMGQVNLIKISSFCGPNGLIWGYDLVPPCNLYQKHPLRIEETSFRPKVKVYSAQPLLQAFKTLLGTVKEPHFPIFPGSHLFSAYRTIISKGPDNIFASLAVGIAKDRTKRACVLMEDIGRIPVPKKDKADYKKEILQKIVDSVVVIGRNNNIEFKEIFVEAFDIEIEKGEVGCALVAAPYLTLAQQAIELKGRVSFLEVNLEQWQELIKEKFLINCLNR